MNLRASLFPFLPLAASLAFAQSRPPTLDPTYGFPLPRHIAHEAKLPPDADWVWTRETKDHQTVYFRKAFALRHVPKAATLYITADNFFTAYINGHEVGSTHPDPKDGDLWQHVHHYDVAPYLREGSNVAAVVGINDTGPAGVLVRLQADGRPILFSDYTWMQSEAPPPNGWMLPSFSDAGWTGALRIASVGGDPWGNSLQGWPVPVKPAAPYLYHLPLKAVSYALLQQPGSIKGLVWKPTGGKLSVSGPHNGKPWALVVDFGKELTGRVRLDASVPIQVQVGCGEDPSEAIVRPWTTNTLDIGPGQPGFGTYTALRDACLLFPASRTRANLTITMDHLYYPVQYKGNFECSDPMLNRIWYTGAYTAHSCMQQDIWDAPKRDRARWMGDLHVSGEVINNVFADKFLMEHTLTLLRGDAQGGRPFTELPKDHVNGIPGYSCAWVCGLADFYRHVGDRSYLMAQHDALVSMLEYFRAELDDNDLFANKRGKWPFVDWSPDFDKDTPQARAATDFFLIKALKEAVFLFGAMHDRANASKYAAWCDELTQAAQAHLVDENGRFGDRRQENAMAIYSGAATPAETESIWNGVLNLQSPSWQIMATPYYNNYVIYAMSLSGHTQDALKFVRTYWGDMIDEGATTFWEGYDPSWPKDNFHAHLQADDGTGYFVSLCHGWSAGATDFLTERILGVQPTSGGFASCDIEPQLCGLSWVKGEVPTPYGNIRVSVRASGGKAFVRLHLPSGVAARVGGHGATMRTVRGDYSYSMPLNS